MYNKNILIMQFSCQGNSHELIVLATLVCMVIYSVKVNIKIYINVLVCNYDICNMLDL